MFPIQIYVVGVYKHDRSTDKCNISLRLETPGSTPTYITELSLSVSDTEAEPWKALVGKTSTPATLSFPS